MRLPFEKLWSALVNYLLLSHQEIDEMELVQLTWLVAKSVPDHEAFAIDKTLVRSQKLARKAKLSLLLETLGDLEPMNKNEILQLVFLNEFFDEKLFET